MPVNRLSFKDFVTEEALPKIFKNRDDMIEFMSHQSVIPLLYKEYSSSRDIEQIPSFTQMIAAPEKAEYGNYQEATMTQGWNKTVTHVAYGLKVGFSREIQRDLGDMIVSQRTKSFVRSFFDTDERLAAAPFNDGFSTQQSGDGVSVFNSTHPFATGGGSFSNVLATPTELTYEGIKAMTQVFETAQLENGILYRVKPKYLMVPSNLIDDGHQFTTNKEKPGTTNRDINAVASYYGLELLPWNYLSTGKTYFMLADKESLPLVNFVNEGLEFKGYYDEDRDVFVYKGYMRKSYAAFDAHNMVGTNPA